MFRPLLLVLLVCLSLVLAAPVITPKDKLVLRMGRPITQREILSNAERLRRGLRPRPPVRYFDGTEGAKRAEKKMKREQVERAEAVVDSLAL